VAVRVKTFPDGGRIFHAYPLASCGQESSKTLVHQDARCQGAAEEEERSDDGVSDRHPEQGSAGGDRSGVRAAARVREAARAARFDRMATVTFPERVRSYDKAYKLLAGWLHYHGREWFRKYVAVPELHPGGHGWHWHILHGHYLTPTELFAFRESWTRYLQERGMVLPHGSAWVQVHLKKFPTSRTAAGYAAKYVSKALGCGLPPGRQRYLRSEGLARPEVREYLARCLDDCLSWWTALGYKVIDGRERGWGQFIWATDDWTYGEPVR
jgi:hypothetical protein